MAISTSSAAPPPRLLPPQSPPTPRPLPPPPPPNHGPSPPPRLHLRALTAAASASADPRAAHALSVKSGATASDPRAANAVMCGYLRAGALVEAQQVFDRMPARDASSYSALISGHARLGSSAAAGVALLGRMRLAGFAPTKYAFVGLLTACVRSGNPSRLGSQVHALAVKGFTSCRDGSLLVDNALLGMYVMGSRFGDAMKVFDGMENRDVSSWNTVLSGLVELGRFDEAFELFADMRDSGVGADGAPTGSRCRRSWLPPPTGSACTRARRCTRCRSSPGWRWI